MKQREYHAIQSQIDPETWDDEYVDLAKEKALETVTELRKTYGCSMVFRVVKRTVVDEIVC
jgi:sarcosine oxidase delta subunit